MELFANTSRAFRNKNYRSYFIWQLISFIGTWVQATAQSWLVYRLTQSALFLGTVSFVSSIPALILAPLAGVIADKFKRKYLLIGTQMLCVIHGILISILYFTNTINEWHVLFLGIILGIANAFDMTARQSFTPLLVNTEELTNAIALNSSMFNAARMIGPAIAGFLIAEYGEGICFALNTISYIPIIIFIYLVNERKQIITKKTISIMEHIKEGISFALVNSPIKYSLLMVGIFSFCGVSFTALLPIFSDQILHSGAKGLGLLTGTSGIGAVCGGIFLASREKVTGIKSIIAFSGIVGSICLFIFSFSKSFLLSSCLLLVTGFSFITIFAGCNTFLQAFTPENLRGRIISLFSTMLMGMYPLGSLAIGAIAQRTSVSFAVAMSSLICLFSAVIFSYHIPRLKKDTEKLITIENEIIT